MSPALQRLSADLEAIRLEQPVAHVAVVFLNRPESGNGVTPTMCRELLTVIAGLEEDGTVRAVVLTGSGRHFCAGADLKALKNYLQTEPPRTQEPFNARDLFPVTERIVSSRLPFVAAVNGAATAGGLDLALACDVRLASSEARFGETYVRIGLAPGNGGTYFLPRLVGSGIAAELCLTGDIIDAARALEIGLVNRVLDRDELLPESIGLAARIAANPRRAVAATKQALRTSWNMDLGSVLATSYWTVAALHNTADFKEGVEAFVEKRPPRFEGVELGDNSDGAKGGVER